MQDMKIPRQLAALEALAQRFAEPQDLVRRGGHISEISATHLRIDGISDATGLGHIISTRSGLGEVIRIEQDSIMIAPFKLQDQPRIGDQAFDQGPLSISPNSSWKGRVVDALGHPVDDRGSLLSGRITEPSRTPRALARQRVDTALMTGIRVIDIFTPLCFGQRMGIFAGSGVGKSTLLAMLAAAGSFDTVVVALIGERGREVREFLEDTIGDSMGKTIAIVATSDESAMMRRRAPDTAMRIAEHFRDNGDRVLLILDSITRFAHALREVATGAGEPPVARGYPASVFTELPKLLERAGPGIEGSGSITALLSVLVDGDDHNDPIADSVRGILDGHIVLNRAIAEQGRYPPVDPLASISRLANKAWKPDERVLVARLKAMIARFEDTRDLRLLGAYQAGVDAELDQAVRQVPTIYEALIQTPGDANSRDPFTDLARHLKAREAANVPE